MKEITVDVSTTGNVTITTRGYKGTSCRDATKQLEAALGGEIVSDKPTQEMYERERTQLTGRT